MSDINFIVYENMLDFLKHAKQTISDKLLTIKDAHASNNPKVFHHVSSLGKKLYSGHGEVRAPVIHSVDNYLKKLD